MLSSPSIVWFDDQSLISPLKSRQFIFKMAQSEFEIAVDKNGAQTITDSEWRVITQVGRGLSNKEIAQNLIFVGRTVRNHISHILTKLNLRDRTQLVIWSVQNAPVIRGHKMKKSSHHFRADRLLDLSKQFIYVAQSPKTLTLGFYSDSSWDVRNDKGYSFIDHAIKEFEKQNPNVKIKYDSGIRQKNYLDWLADKIVSNQTPDALSRFS